MTPRRRQTTLRAVLLTALSVVLATCSSCARPAGDASATFDRDAALSDGVVSLAEYQQALRAQAACIIAAGFETTNIFQESDKIRWTFNIAVANESDDEAVQHAYDSCYSEYVDGIDSEYYSEHVPSGADRDAMFDELLSCLNRVGVAGLTRASTKQEIVIAIRDQTSDMSPGLLCLDQYGAVFPDGSSE